MWASWADREVNSNPFQFACFGTPRPGRLTAGERQKGIKKAERAVAELKRGRELLRKAARSRSTPEKVKIRHEGLGAVGATEPSGHLDSSRSYGRWWDSAESYHGTAGKLKARRAGAGSHSPRGCGPPWLRVPDGAGPTLVPSFLSGNDRPAPVASPVLPRVEPHASLPGLASKRCRRISGLWRRRAPEARTWRWRDLAEERVAEDGERVVGEVEDAVSTDVSPAKDW